MRSFTPCRWQQVIVGLLFFHCIYCGMKCPNPPLIENATYTIDLGGNTELVNGSSAVYFCTPGHEMVNENASTLLCTSNTESRVSSWQGEKPVCKEKCSCPDPGVSVDGNRSGNCCSCGDTIHFSCGDQFELVGNVAIQCLENGSWSSARPLCRPLKDYCEFPPPMLGGTLVGWKNGDYFTYGRYAEFVCERGYKTEEKKSFYCYGRGVWDHEFGTCKEIFCDRPKPIKNGRIPELQDDNSTFFPYGFQINYVCDEGYALVFRESWKMCEEMGWSGWEPFCASIGCPYLEVPENGLKIGDNNTVGSSVRFMCFPGYELLGSVERHCTRTGEWTGQLSRCNIKSNYCPNPGTPIRGEKNTTEYGMGDKVMFWCRSSYILIGSKIRECLPDKTWSGTEAKCVYGNDYDSEIQARDILRAKLVEMREEQRKEVQKFESIVCPIRPCFDWALPQRIMLYFVIELSESTANFEASIAFAKAVVKMVDISQHGARAGAVTFRSGTEMVFSPLDYSSTEAVLDALDRINNTREGRNVTWRSSLRVIRHEYTPLVNLRFGKKQIKSSVIFLLTGGRAKFGGDPKWEAHNLKAEGVDIYCIGITADDKRKALYDIASTTKYWDEIRQNVFLLQDYRRLAWLAEEVTNEIVDNSQCGLGSENIGIKRSSISGSTYAWPWMAALYETSGNSVPTTYSFVCGGSIIHRKFVLTAAHCMYDEESRERNSNEIMVKLANGTHLQEFEVRNINIHPGYRNRTVMDYDIALLELQNPIEYSLFVRPICLPPKAISENSNLYENGSIAWALRGTGIHEERVPELIAENPVVSQHLKEIDLLIQPREYCEASLRNHTLEDYFTERIFCAAEGKSSACGDHGGGPVMKLQANPEGHLIWTQVGIDSGDAGCTTQDEYGFYPDLQQLMPWVDATIETAPSG